MMLRTISHAENHRKSQEILNVDCKNKTTDFHEMQWLFWKKNAITAFHRCYMDELKISTFRCLQIIIAP